MTYPIHHMYIQSSTDRMPTLGSYSEISVVVLPL